MLGVGALYAVRPDLVGVLGSIPPEELAATYAMPNTKAGSQRADADPEGCDASGCSTSGEYCGAGGSSCSGGSCGGCGGGD